MNDNHGDEANRVNRLRDEVAGILAATLLDMILAGDGPATKTADQNDLASVREQRRCR